MALSPQATTSESELPKLSFLHAFRDSYVRTRHSNLRCFPSCSRVHRESSFCGRSVEIKVLKTVLTEIKNAIVIGEFRALDSSPSFAVSETFTKTRIKEEVHRIELAEYVNSNDTYYRFVFTPNKKWRYDARISKQQELHVFTVYVISDETIVEILDSKGFLIIPVWKAEESILDEVAKKVLPGETNNNKIQSTTNRSTPALSITPPPSQKNIPVSIGSGDTTLTGSNFSGSGEKSKTNPKPNFSNYPFAQAQVPTTFQGFLPNRVENGTINQGLVFAMPAQGLLAPNGMYPTGVDVNQPSAIATYAAMAGGGNLLGYDSMQSGNLVYGYPSFVSIPLDQTLRPQLQFLPQNFSAVPQPGWQMYAPVFNGNDGTQQGLMPNRLPTSKSAPTQSNESEEETIHHKKSRRDKDSS